MSTDLAARIQEDHLTCQICFQAFTKPKALPCLHTFCEECLRDYTVSRSYDTVGQFQCPMCRKAIDIPPGGVSNFQDNHLVQSLSHTVVGPEIAGATRIQAEGSDVDPSFRPIPAPRKSKLKPEPEVENEPELKPPPPYPVPPPLNLPTPLPSTGFYPELPALSPTSPQPLQRPVIACSNGLVEQIGKYGPSRMDFQRPKGLAVGLKNEIIVSDLGGNRIFVYSHGGHLQCYFECDCVVHDLTVTPRGTILVAVNKAKSAIMREYSLTGRLIASYGNYYKFENPSGIALNSEGFSVVTCLDSCVMYIFTDQKKMSQKVGSKGSGNDHFLSPYHVAVNNKDQIFVSDCGNNCIKMFSKGGKFKMSIGREGSGPGELKAPLGICSNVDGYIIVADSGNSRVQVFNQKGQYYCVPVQHTEKIGAEVKPTNVAVTSHNNLVVLLSGKQFAEVRVYSFKSENGVYCSTCYVQ
ncbi:tripartite motif-containing protein 2-like [Liolophura sinensis]|uniref:tripartite motif-containing protein 2-like n=1 Tax=Liolophura sinensis TaxID=3198878 RepID=UPI0031595C59